MCLFMLHKNISEIKPFLNLLKTNIYLYGLTKSKLIKISAEII